MGAQEEGGSHRVGQPGMEGPQRGLAHRMRPSPHSSWTLAFPCHPEARPAPGGCHLHSAGPTLAPACTPAPTAGAGSAGEDLVLGEAQPVSNETTRSFGPPETRGTRARARTALRMT